MAEYTKAQLTEMIVGKLQRNFGRTVEEATDTHMFKACALVLRDIMSLFKGYEVERSDMTLINNLLEQVEQELAVVDGKVTFTIKPYEIFTILLK